MIQVKVHQNSPLIVFAGQTLKMKDVLKFLDENLTHQEKIAGFLRYYERNKDKIAGFRRYRRLV